MASSDKLMRGAKAGGAGVAGTLVLGPVAGPAIAGYAADNFVGGQTRYFETGIAMALGGLLIGGAATGGGSGGVM